MRWLFIFIYMSIENLSPVGFTTCPVTYPKVCLVCLEALCPCVLPQRKSCSPRAKPIPTPGYRHCLLRPRGPPTCGDELTAIRWVKSKIEDTSHLALSRLDATYRTRCLWSGQLIVGAITSNYASLKPRFVYKLSKGFRSNYTQVLVGSATN